MIRTMVDYRGERGWLGEQPGIANTGKDDRFGGFDNLEKASLELQFAP